MTEATITIGPDLLAQFITIHGQTISQLTEQQFVKVIEIELDEDTLILKVDVDIMESIVN